MSLKEFQQALVDLTLKPKSGRALRGGDTGCLGGYDLDERERDRLIEISRQPGMAMNCSLARGNRLEFIVASFPMTCTLLKPLLPRLLDELWAQHRPDNYQLAGEEDAFSTFICGKMGEGELAGEYLAEVLAYELVLRGLTAKLDAGSSVNTRLEAIVDFSHPPGQLLLPLERLETPPPGLPVGRYRARLEVSETGVLLEVIASDAFPEAELTRT